jgi:uncharacterized protein YjbI with pentapeptide repeats
MHFTGSLRGMDFSGQDLSGALFLRADLYEARFDEARLEGAVFQNCFAAESSFARAHCAGMRAVQTNLYRGNFRGADLSGALLWNCVLAWADLRGARLQRVTVTLDCNSFEHVELGAAASAELAYLFGRASSPIAVRWLDVLGERNLVWLERLFAR